MAKVSYVSPEGADTTLDVADGTTVMKAAVLGGVEGIIGECGGNLMCATCHVYVAKEWQDRIPAKGEVEEEMLEEAASEVTDCSRLSCQIVAQPALDGLVVRIPDRQV